MPDIHNIFITSTIARLQLRALCVDMFLMLMWAVNYISGSLADSSHNWSEFIAIC